MVVVTYRIKYPQLNVVESVNEGKSWKKSSVKFLEAMEVVKLFKAHGNMGALVDMKNKGFLKGQISGSRVLGARINILPDGRELNKAYSLFCPKLRIHDESSNSHWDVMFQNPNGNFAYVYTLEKEKLSKIKKYKGVNEFAKKILMLEKNLNKELGKDPIVLPMLILLKTKMRVGNETYYLKNQHKGLTTLKKKDIKIKRSNVVFDYIAKDGVPQKITEKFSDKCIKVLKDVLKKKKDSDFVFVNGNGHPLKDTEFEKAFQKYCGGKFYPHIIRSYYATEEAKKFLEKHKSATKEEKETLYIKIAEKLGHKSFSKKKNDWINSPKVTVHYYIQPELVERIEQICVQANKIYNK